MSNGRPTLDIVIVNYRSPQMTVETVRRVEQSVIEGHEVRIWVVDNGSGDGSADILKHELPGVRLIVSPGNLGFSGGNNLALARILEDGLTGDPVDSYILLLNNDVLVEPDSIQICIDALREFPDVGAVGPRVRLPDGRLDLACRRGFPTPASAFWKLTGLAKRFPDNPRFAGYNLTYLPEDQPADVDAVTAAFMVVRVAVVRQVGLLDERFFMYGEDLDWAYRIKAAGWRILYWPAAEVVHLKSATSRRHSSRIYYEFYRAMWLFHEKHYARRYPFLLNMLVMIGIVTRGLLALIVNAFKPADRKKFA